VRCDGPPTARTSLVLSGWVGARSVCPVNVVMPEITTSAVEPVQAEQL